MSRYDDMPEPARSLMADFDEIDLAEMLAGANDRIGELRQRVTELEARLAEAGKYAPASDVRPGWAVRVGVDEFTVTAVYRQDANSLNLMYADNRSAILNDDEPVIVVHRCDPKEADRG